MKLFYIFFTVIILLSGCDTTSAPSLTPSPTTTAPIATKTSTPTPMPTTTPTQTPEPTPEPTQIPPERTLIAKASTPLVDKGEARLANIRRAAKEISAMILAPGEVFSFNAVVGARTASTGYEKAPAIVEGEKQMEYGGGVCQLATTICQAADKAGLAILERHNHQKEVAYAAQGTDAAVNYGTLDMKFKNTSNHSVMIAILVGKNTVNAEIYRMNY